MDFAESEILIVLVILALVAVLLATLRACDREPYEPQMKGSAC